MSVDLLHHEPLMRRALTQARLAQAQGEVPVGAVIVRGDTVLAAAGNQPLGKHDPTAHAEVRAIRAAGQVIGNYRLVDCSIYVTLEPCMMCLGAIVHARIAHVIFAASDPKSGVLGGRIDVSDSLAFNHRFSVTSGVLAEESSLMLKQFFKDRRT
ncbi:MAG: tRNA adenosine(34) deaminase TadA [Pseudomonadota bacterium]